MSDEPENLVLVYLRRLDEKLDRLAADTREMRQRVNTVEHQIAQFVATEAAHYASLAGRLDSLNDRVERIERRLDLIGEPAP